MEKDVYKKIIEIIESKREHIIKFAQKLVQIPSVTGEENEIQKYIANKLQSMGLELDVFEIDVEELSKHPFFVPLEDYRKSYKDRPNVVGTLKGKGGGRSLILMGHVDTVPVESRSSWSHDPFGGDIDNGKLYGRGALDQKGGVAAQIMAVESIIDAGLSLKGDVIIENTIEEEAGGNGALACAVKGYRADAGIYTEPSGYTIGISNRGAQFFRITVPGIATGIEAKWGTPNAIEKAFYLYRAIDDFSLMRQVEVMKLPSYRYYVLEKDDLNYLPFGPKDERVIDILNQNIVPTGVCKINGGVWPSSTPEQCILEGSLECLPEEDIREVRERFRSYLLQACKMDEWLRNNPPNIEWFGLWFESCITDVNHPIINLIQKYCREIVKVMPKLKGGGGSDLRCLVKYANTPTVIFGGGCGGNAHGVDEYLEIESLINSTKILALTILSWCGEYS
jgi:acetylornithine deacetylase